MFEHYLEVSKIQLKKITMTKKANLLKLLHVFIINNEVYMHE